MVDDTQNDPTENMTEEEEQAYKLSHDNRSQRFQTYPSLQEQFDMLWHAIDEGHITADKENSVFYNTIKQIKDDNPYPEVSPE